MNTQLTITEQVSAVKDKIAQSRGRWKQRLPDNVFYPLNNAVLLTEKIESLLKGLCNELFDALYNIEKGGGAESELAKTIEELADSVGTIKKERNNERNTNPDGRNVSYRGYTGKHTEC